MGYRRFTGCLSPFQIPMPLFAPGISFQDVALTTAAHQYAAIGPVIWADGVSHAIRKVGVRFGAITVGTGTTTVRVSLQNVLGTGDAVPYRPDGTVDQSWTSAIGSLTANVMNVNQLDADRASVANGSMLAVMVDFSAFGTSPSLGVGFWQTPGGASQWAHRVGCVLSTDTGTTWAASAREPVVIFESDGGVIGTLALTCPATSFNTVAFNSGSTDFEQGLEQVAEHTFKAAGVMVWAYASTAAADFDVKIYEGTSVLETVNVPYEHLVANNTRIVTPVYFSQDLTITRGTTYRIMVAPSGAQDVRLMYMDFQAATHRAAMWGTEFAFNTKRTAGFQTATTTRLPAAWWIPAGIDDGTGGGASGSIYRGGGPRVMRP